MCLLALLVAMALALTACSGPVSTSRPDLKAVQQDLARSAVTTRQPSWATRNLLLMQEYCRDMDKNLTIDNLDQLRSKLKLPPGWKFETKVLAKDLVLDTTKSDGWASIIRDACTAPTRPVATTRTPAPTTCRKTTHRGTVLPRPIPRKENTMKLKTGPTRRVHAKNTRGAAFCGLGAFVGVGRTQRAHVYTATTLPESPPRPREDRPEETGA